METPETKQAELQELAQRRTDGMLVTLWWVKGTMDTYVEVVDLDKHPPAVTEIAVVPPATPNEVFNHPFAHTPTIANQSTQG